MQERIKELVNILNKANYEYHVLDNPTISDQEYDKYLRELYQLEEKYPEYVLENSPTKKIGGEVIDEFKKITLSIPMMSLSKNLGIGNCINIPYILSLLFNSLILSINTSSITSFSYL